MLLEIMEHVTRVAFLESKTAKFILSRVVLFGVENDEVHFVEGGRFGVGNGAVHFSNVGRF